MLSTPHVVTGVAIAYAIPNPLVSIPLAFCSHFVLEMIPHWNPHLNTEMRTYGRLTNTTLGLIAIDAILAIGLAFYLSFNLALGNNYLMYSMLGAAVASILPDVFEVPYFFFHFRNKTLNWWLRFQKSIQSDAGPVGGILTQFALVFVLLLWLL